MNPLKIEVVDIAKVIPYEKNVKNHIPEQIDKIAKSITEFGFDQPIVVDSNYVIIKGHGRRLAAVKLGFKQVPVLVRTDLTEDQVKASRLSDNRVAVGDIDINMFRDELASMNFDMTGIFDIKELEFTAADLGSMDMGAFITDLTAEVDAQEADTDRKVTAMLEKEIPIYKLLGFRHVTGAEQIHFTRFIAQVESVTGKVGKEAFIDFIKEVTTQQAQD